MPVKPSTTFTLATNANFTVGPFIGSATKVIPADIGNGMVPGTGIVAEWANYLWHWTGEWITDWVDLGSSAEGLDAHIMETDASGQNSTAGVALGGTAAAFRALTVNENAAASNSTADFDNASAGFAILASANGANAAVRGLNTGTGPGVEGRALGTNNNGVEGYGQDLGDGVAGFGDTTGDGVHGVSGSTAGAGVRGEGQFVAAAFGVVGVVSHDDGTAIQGTTALNANATAIGVEGIGRNEGVGVLGQSSNGYGVVAESDQTSPNRAAFRMVPQDDDPATPQEGDQIYNSTTDEVRTYANSRWQTLWSTADGFTRGFGSGGSATNNSAATYTTLSTALCTAPYDPKHTGFVVVQASAEFGADAGTVHTTIDVRIRDTTAGATVWSQTIDHPNANAGPIFDRPWSIVVVYALPATGARTFELQFKKTGGAGTGIGARDGGIFVLGVF